MNSQFSDNISDNIEESEFAADTLVAATKHHRAHEVFIVIVSLMMIALCVIFVFLPRSTYSELEKRDLTKFPELSEFNGNPREYTAKISSWFSDSEPYRDRFMTLSMMIRDMLKFSFRPAEETVSFRPIAETTSATDGTDDDAPGQEFTNPLAEENAKVASKGIIVVGSGNNVRALMAFGGKGYHTESYINLCGEYAETFPDVQIYAMVAPSATEFYLPEKAKNCSSPQLPVLEYIREHLPANVKYVDVYSELAAHVDEDIYLRTDHHWGPLGGYYGAKAFARTAGVPFKDLSNYETRTVHGVVGSMYGYSNDISVKNSPEDFTYYMPKGLDYTTTYITYKLNADYQVVSQSGPYKGQYFHHFKDGAGGAYCTFMGGDQHLVKIETGINTNRKLLIIKDSFGNAVPSNLFYSFSEIHVVDFRYFKYNMKEYVKNNGITDLILFFNVFNVCGSTGTSKVRKFLTQPSGDFSVTPKKSPETEEVKTEEAQPAVEEAQPQPQEEPEPAPAPPAEPEET